MTRQLWLELPPISTTAPSRLLVFLHGAGSSPEAFAAIAIAWQLKFPGAHAIILQGQPVAEPAGSAWYEWFDANASAEQRRDLAQASAAEVARRIRHLQNTLEIGAERTILIGFSQGATVALEVCRLNDCPVDIVVSYAGRLARPIGPGERIDATVHLVHGQLDTWVPVVHSQRALRGLAAAGAQVTLDITEDGLHSIGPDMIIIGTTRAMQTVFKGRAPRRQLPPSSFGSPPTLH